MAAGLLAVIERGYRGSVEVQYGDLLYVCRGLQSVLGGVDLVLRGSAVTFALAPGAEPAAPPAHEPDAEPGRVPDPRAGLAGLIAAGSRVWVDEPDLCAIGCAHAALLPGAERRDTDLMSELWPEYREVWYL